jgi:copper chaperone CopZ
MFRREFVRLVAAVGAGSVVSTVAAQSAEAAASQSVTLHLKGFSCVTCAVGLDTMLKQKKGVAWSKSTYPEGIVTIKFDPREVSESALKAFIADMGFTVDEPSTGK